MKICTLCNQPINPGDYYAGNATRHKSCHRQDMRDKRAANPEKYKDIDAKRFQNDPKVGARHRAYQATAAGRVSMKKSHTKWIAANLEKRAAQVKVGNAIRDGKLIRPDICENCGVTGKKIQAHHEDYDKPLDVNWLCIPCHRKRHN